MAEDAAPNLLLIGEGVFAPNLGGETDVAEGAAPDLLLIGEGVSGYSSLSWGTVSTLIN